MNTVCSELTKQAVVPVGRHGHGRPSRPYCEEGGVALGPGSMGDLQVLTGTRPKKDMAEAHQRGQSFFARWAARRPMVRGAK